jgi:hypothetical protein
VVEWRAQFLAKNATDSGRLSARPPSTIVCGACLEFDMDQNIRVRRTIILNGQQSSGPNVHFGSEADIFTFPDQCPLYPQKWTSLSCRSLTQFERPGHRTLGLGNQLCFAPMDKDSEGDDRDHGDNDQKDRHVAL